MPIPAPTPIQAPSPTPFGSLYPQTHFVASPDLRPCPSPYPLLKPFKALTLNTQQVDKRGRGSTGGLGGSVVARDGKYTHMLSECNQVMSVTTDVPEDSIDSYSQLMSPTQQWETTLSEAIKAIVSIRANTVRNFDTELVGAYNATGFIVDAANGIILSNRHVVSPAPILAKAVLSDYEEVTIHPIYRDPIHDFGFFRFDPEKIKFMNLTEIELDPTAAHIGSEIKVVGNDAGEKLSILTGTIARLDRAAPDYGQGMYTDFNTFYLQAASGTSGGSSGSPVLNIDGKAIALNAGGASKAASSYYFPLDRVNRAFKLIREGQPVTRGTIQTEWEHLPYDEVRRLGLTPEFESKIRRYDPLETGLLTVKQVLPGGPAHGKLQAGDILLAVNEQIGVRFVQLESIMDDNVTNSLRIQIQRGAKVMEFELVVQDLHSITPASFLDIGDGVLNNLSYQIARSYACAVTGVYVASSGYMFAYAGISRKSVITQINHVPVTCIEDVVRIIRNIPDKKQVPVRYYSLSKMYQERVAIIHMDWTWFQCKLYNRNDDGRWAYQKITPEVKTLTIEPRTATFPKISASLSPGNLLINSLVSVDFHIPFLVEGIVKSQAHGTGLVLDKEKGIVVTDKTTVPIVTGDVYLTFASSLILQAKVLFIHPIYNFTLLSYDVAALGDTDVKSAVLDTESKIVQGDGVSLVMLSDDNSLLVRNTTVKSVTEMYSAPSTPPRWRPVNVEKIELNDSSSGCGGVVASADGKVRALWVTYIVPGDKGDMQLQHGLPIHLLAPAIECSSSMFSLPAEIWTMKLSQARELGLTDEWVRKVEAAQHSRHTILQVLGVSASEARKHLQAADIILDVNGTTPTRLSDIATLLSSSGPTWNCTVLRGGSEVKLEIPLRPIVYPTPRTAIIGWAGAKIQEAYGAVLDQVKSIANGPYISCTYWGSPADEYNLRSGVWLTEINGEPVRDLAHCWSIVSSLAKRQVGSDDGAELEYIRLSTVNRNGVARVLSLKTDEHYWPTHCVDLVGGGVVYLS